MQEPKIFPVRVLFVYDAMRYEVMVSLDFGVFVKKPIRLNWTREFPLGSSADPKELALFRAAKKTAMDLALGKMAFARIQETRKNTWADLYVCGEPPAGVEGETVEGERVFDMKKALEVAAAVDYDVAALGWQVYCG